jgi:hypothetical protein
MQKPGQARQKKKNAKMAAEGTWRIIILKKSGFTG